MSCFLSPSLIDGLYYAYPHNQFSALHSLILSVCDVNGLLKLLLYTLLVMAALRAYGLRGGYVQ